MNDNPPVFERNEYHVDVPEGARLDSQVRKIFITRPSRGHLFVEGARASAHGDTREKERNAARGREGERRTRRNSGSGGGREERELTTFLRSSYLSPARFSVSFLARDLRVPLSRFAMRNFIRRDNQEDYSPLNLCSLLASLLPSSCRFSVFAPFRAEARVNAAEEDVDSSGSSSLRRTETN